MKSSVTNSKLTANDLKTESPSITGEQGIRNRAYELYEQRGHTHGHDVEDWLQAESELNSNLKAA